MQLLYTIADSIYFSFKIIIPVFFVLRMCKVSLQLEISILIKALNYTLLLASFFFLAEIFLGIISEHYSPGEQRHTTTFNRATGPYWFGFWLPLMANGLLPQLIWFKKVRKNGKLLYIWFVIATLLSLFIKFVMIEIILHSDFIPSTLSSVGIVYNLLVSPVYFALSLTSTLAVVSALYWLMAKQAKKPDFL
jgi:hypothetical protein